MITDVAGLERVKRTFYSAKQKTKERQHLRYIIMWKIFQKEEQRLGLPVC